MILQTKISFACRNERLRFNQRNFSQFSSLFGSGVPLENNFLSFYLYLNIVFLWSKLKNKAFLKNWKIFLNRWVFFNLVNFPVYDSHQNLFLSLFPYYYPIFKFQLSPFIHSLHMGHQMNYFIIEKANKLLQLLF